MTEPEYRNAKARLERYLKKWHKLLEMGYYKLSYDYDRGYHDEDGSIAAITNTQWEYRQGFITWYIGACNELTDEELEVVVAHEFLHVLLGPIAHQEPSTSERQNMELVVTTLSRLMQRMVT